MKSIRFNNSGERDLVENCQKIGVNQVIRKLRENFKDVIPQTVVEISNQQIKITTQQLHHKGNRYWFICPLCNQQVGVIYQHYSKKNAIGCRKCLQLEYRCRRYKGMIENELQM